MSVPMIMDLVDHDDTCTGHYDECVCICMCEECGGDIRSRDARRWGDVRKFGVFCSQECYDGLDE